jgi:hypothetical protein
VTADAIDDSYIGLASTTFKARHSNHLNTFKYDKHIGKTSLATHIWALKHDNKTFDIKWEIIDKATTYNPINQTCNLCLKEKLYIITKPELCSINKRDELTTKCLHRHKFLFSSS